MSAMTDKNATGQAQGQERHHVPKMGERFRCQQCGMEIQVTNGCKCRDAEHVHFQCCGQEMRPA